jgi:hypothetical protein
MCITVCFKKWIILLPCFFSLFLFCWRFFFCCSCFASLRCANHFSKRKTGKKKADNQSEQCDKPKGNGIKEGFCERRIVFMPNAFGWLCAAAARCNLAAFLPVELGKNIINNYLSVIKIMN